jgi:hypothetical protein
VAIIASGRKNDRPGGHRGNHFGRQDTAHGHTEEYVGVNYSLLERSTVSVGGISGLASVHAFIPAGIYDPCAIHHENVFPFQAKIDQHIQAGDAGSPGAGGSQADFIDGLAHDSQ